MPEFQTAAAPKTMNPNEPRKRIVGRVVGQPWELIGTLGIPETTLAIGAFVECSLGECEVDETERFEFMIVELSDDEVEDLPEL